MSKMRLRLVPAKSSMRRRLRAAVSPKTRIWTSQKRRSRSGLSASKPLQTKMKKKRRKARTNRS